MESPTIEQAGFDAPTVESPMLAEGDAPTVESPMVEDFEAPTVETPTIETTGPAGSDSAQDMTAELNLDDLALNAAEKRPADR